MIFFGSLASYGNSFYFIKFVFFNNQSQNEFTKQIDTVHFNGNVTIMSISLGDEK